MTTQAKAAKQLKKELKKEFPGVKFSVKSESFSGGDAVRVSYTDGPTTKEVKAIADKYQYGSFDGMRDIYEMTNTDENLPQVKYVTINRSWSDETKEKLFNKIIEDFGLDADTRPSYRLDSGVELRTKAHREFSATSM